MADRRDTRFRLKQPAQGTVQTFTDVIVQPNGKDEWIAIGREAAVIGETLVLDIVAAGRPGRRFPVRAIDSRPVMVDGRLRHQIRLHRDAKTPLCSNSMSRVDDLTEMCDWPAALTREHRIRVQNISELGCLVESRRRLDVGAVANLRLQLGTGEYHDDVQVVRCQPNESGLAIYDVAMRFLPTTPLHAGSIRYAIACYAAELDFAETTVVR